MKTIAKRHAETFLEEHCRRWLNRLGRDGGYGYGASSVYEDLMHGGCQSGMVGHLIYYKDTVKFYKRHRKDIHALLVEALDGTDLGSPKGLFADKWDDEDPMADEHMNQNLLAWFGFEEAARTVYERAENAEG